MKPLLRRNARFRFRMPPVLGLLNCFQTAWRTSWTRRNERQNSFWNPFAPTRESTWRSHSLRRSGDNIRVTCLELANQRVRRFERLFRSTNGRLSVLWWCDRPFLVEFELLLSHSLICGVAKCVLAWMGLQTRRGISWMTNHAWPCDQEGEISQGHFSWHSLIAEDCLPLMMTTVVLFDWRRTVQYFLTVVRSVWIQLGVTQTYSYCHKKLL